MKNGDDISFKITSDQHHTVRIRLKEPLLLLEDGVDVRPSYFSRCEVRKIIHEDGAEEDIEEGHESIYKVYKIYCEKYNIKNFSVVNLLDIFYDRSNIKLRDKI